MGSQPFFVKCELPPTVLTGFLFTDTTIPLHSALSAVGTFMFSYFNHSSISYLLLNVLIPSRQ